VYYFNYIPEENIHQVYKQ